MKITLTLNDDLIYPVAGMLAKEIVRFISARRIAITTPGLPVREWQYREWRGIQNTLRQVRGQDRARFLHYIRDSITQIRRDEGLHACASTWLTGVRDHSAALGEAMTEVRHQPGLFLREEVKP